MAKKKPIFGTSKAVMVSMPVKWLAAFREQAKRDAQDDSATLSEWLGECACANLDADLLRGLPLRRPARRPTLQEARRCEK